jgi:hypothetical protein
MMLRAWPVVVTMRSPLALEPLNIRKAAGVELQCEYFRMQTLRSAAEEILFNANKQKQQGEETEQDKPSLSEM